MTQAGRGLVIALVSSAAVLLDSPHLAAQDAVTPTSLRWALAPPLLPLGAGDTIVAPAGFHHYSIAKGTTVVSVRLIGPYTITYVHTYEAPRQASFPYSY